MKKILLLLITGISAQLFAQQQIKLEQAKFKTGDNIEWKSPKADDSQWATIKTNLVWEEQGYPNYDGMAWYRFHFYLPSSLKDQSLWKDSLRVFLAKIDDRDESFINGVSIGKTSGYNKVREYHVAVNSTFLKWDADNVLAIKVFDRGGEGGMYGGTPFINMMDLIDGISMHLHFSSADATIEVHNNVNTIINGTLHVEIIDPESNKTVSIKDQNISLPSGGSTAVFVTNDTKERLSIVATYQELLTKKTLQLINTTPYILTPLPGASPKINGASVFGVKPGSPVLYKIAATGEIPLQYAVDDLPKGLQIDGKTGIITGVLTKKGNYILKAKVSNAKGIAEKNITLKVGDLLALTPPMGWNSWNCWGLSVSSEKVKSSATALIEKGLINHGWTYMNIDDGWEDSLRDNAGNVVPNKKFPDMKALGDWLHGNGLKFGIYSSPGPKTCGGYLGSYQYELNDANSYAKWGIDYLKYDLCSYRSLPFKDTTLSFVQKPYYVMRDALLKQKRDIVYSLCEYGLNNVWQWGDLVNGNCWRTTGDINDTWESLSSIGFNQTEQYKYAKPGRWNDPDMLIVGMVGWGENLHPTRLSPDEQYTHISLWCLLSAPLLIGCDMSKLDDFTINLLSNDEVLAVNQDALGTQAKQVYKNENYQVWMKTLEDGSHAVGIFNLTEQYQTISINWKDIELVKPDSKKVRDLWRQKDLGMFRDAFSTKVAPHGVTFIKVIG